LTIGCQVGAAGAQKFISEPLQLLMSIVPKPPIAGSYGNPATSEKEGIAARTYGPMEWTETMIVRVFRNIEPAKAVFESQRNSCTPRLDAVKALRSYLHVRHLLLILEDIVAIADDPHQGLSDYQIAANQLLSLIFTASGYRLEVDGSHSIAKPEGHYGL
jgi:hypothetical protein